MAINIPRPGQARTKGCGVLANSKGQGWISFQSRYIIPDLAKKAEMRSLLKSPPDRLLRPEFCLIGSWTAYNCANTDSNRLDYLFPCTRVCRGNFAKEHCNCQKELAVWFTSVRNGLCDLIITYIEDSGTDVKRLAHFKANYNRMSTLLT